MNIPTTIPSLAKMAEQPLADSSDNGIPSSYEIFEAIGKGRTATIHFAFDKILRRVIALKRFHAESGPEVDQLNSEKFEAIGKLAHRNIVELHDTGQDTLGHFMTMALIKGETLEQKLAKGPLEFSDFLHIAQQSLEGLQALHSANVLHLDLKPSNFMISQSKAEPPHLQIISFDRSRMLNSEGICPNLDDDERCGSIYFTSPEEFCQAPLTPRSDIYSLGCVFYFLLTGSFPFLGNPAQVVVSHMQNRVTPLGKMRPELSMWVQNIIMSMISLDPAERPQSAQEILDRIQDARMNFGKGPIKEAQTPVPSSEMVNTIPPPPQIQQSVAA